MKEDKNDLKKSLKLELKRQIVKKSVLLFPYDFEKIFKKDTLTINLKGKKIGEIIIRPLTGSHLRFGAISSFVIEGRIVSSLLTEELSNMKLSFVDLQLLETQGLFYLYSGYLNNKAYFKDYGVISFYINDNIEEKVLEMIEHINSFFSIKMVNIFSGNISVIDDIFSEHKFYPYPTAFSAVSCKINNQIDLLNATISKCKAKKMQDSSKDNISEILEKI